MKKIILSIILLFAMTQLQARQLGEWAHYLSYNKLTHVVPTDNEVFAVSDGRLFSYNVNDGSVTGYSTVNGLSDNTDIADICWNRQTKCLVIGYANGNLDMLSTKDYSVVNSSAILNENTQRSKEIYGLACDGVNAYVLMQYGAVKLNTQRREISEVYRFEVDGYFMGARVENDSLFLLNRYNMSQYDNETILTGSLKDNLMDRTKWKVVKYWRRKAQITDSIRADLNSRRVYNSLDRTNTVRNTTPMPDYIHHCSWTEAGDGTLMKVKLQEDGTYAPQWERGVKPDGPETNSFFNISWMNDRLYTASRGWMTLADSSEPARGHMYKPGTGWAVLEMPSKDELGFDFVAASEIAVDPRDTAHVMVAAKSGLYEYYGGKFVKRWYNANSPIRATDNNTSPTYQMVLTATYDKNGTLWLLNTLSSNALLRLDQTLVNGVATESRWTHMPHSELDNEAQHFVHARWDKSGNLWFINSSWIGQAYYCYNPASDVLTKYTPTYNQDGTSLYDESGAYYLHDINIDNSGNVWLCGTAGVCYLPARNVGTPTNVVEQYKVARNDGTGLADYLLSTVNANCIIFDGAGRKFIGTVNNGVYVISADNETEVENYTVENSELLSNNVYGLAIDQQTGTLYCATARGLCSVTTDAVAVPASLDKNNVKVYPNPVAPSYTGMITIEGVTIGADIKITTASGYVVHTGRTTSAMYQWDGCDLSGQRCASGIYNVLIATEDASEGCVAKIAMVK